MDRGAEGAAESLGFFLTKPNSFLGATIHPKWNLNQHRHHMDTNKQFPGIGFLENEKKTVDEMDFFSLNTRVQEFDDVKPPHLYGIKKEDSRDENLDVNVSNIMGFEPWLIQMFIFFLFFIFVNCSLFLGCRRV